MRIEAFLQQGLPSIQQEQISSLPQTGEVIRAAVLSQDDGTVMLKAEDGRVFQASLASEAMLLPNDNAELLVVDSSPEKLLLRLVFVEPAVQSMTAFTDKAAPAEGAVGQDMAELVAAFTGKEGKPSAQTLANAQQAMREYGVDFQTAAFFAANGIEITEVGLRALHQLVQGNTTGTVIAQTAQSILQNDVETSMQSSAAVSGERTQQSTNSVLPDGLPAHSAGYMPLQQSTSAQLRNADTDLSSTQSGGGIRQVPAGVVDADASQVWEKLPKENAGKAGDQFATSPRAEVIDDQAAQASEEKPFHSGRQRGVAGQGGDARNEGINTNMSEGMNPSGEKMFRSERNFSAGVLKEKMLSLFLRADDGLDGKAVKTAVADAKNQLALLQEITKHTDINAKQNVTVRLNDAQAQMQLTEDISRFICLQIPVSMQGYETAELYVYKRNRKGGRIDPENTSIVLGISTESLGRVEALLRVENRTISLAFGVENEAMIPVFREESTEMRKALSELRYSLTEYKVSGLSEPTTPLNAEEKLRASVKRRHSGSVEYMV